jgi:hypothetical protein
VLKLAGYTSLVITSTAWATSARVCIGAGGVCVLGAAILHLRAWRQCRETRPRLEAVRSSFLDARGQLDHAVESRLDAAARALQYY